MTNCLEFVTNSGNAYHNFYEIEKLRNRSESNNDLVNVQLYILGAMDAHIMLTPCPHPPADTPLYEIGKNVICKTNKGCLYV